MPSNPPPPEPLRPETVLRWDPGSRDASAPGHRASGGSPGFSFCSERVGVESRGFSGFQVFLVVCLGKRGGRDPHGVVFFLIGFKRSIDDGSGPIVIR